MVGLNTNDVEGVTKFIIALRGLGRVSLMQSSWAYTFTTPELELERNINDLETGQLLIL